MKLAFVVQRYGMEINGGAELHCRWIAEHMRKYSDVEVLTTRALDYITWENHYPGGTEDVNGVPVRRFSVTRTRSPERFGRLQRFILANEHWVEDELRWIEEEGPCAPSLIRYISNHAADYDYFIFLQLPVLPFVFRGSGRPGKKHSGPHGRARRDYPAQDLQGPL